MKLTAPQIRTIEERTSASDTNGRVEITPAERVEDHVLVHIDYHLYLIAPTGKIVNIQTMTQTPEQMEAFGQIVNDLIAP
jgi:hypothetical protein